MVQIKSNWRHMEENTALARAASFTITHPDKPEGYAVINIAYPKDGAGRLTVYVVDAFGETRTCERGQASGFGYDKVTAALRGLSVDGVKFTDHCGSDEKSNAWLAEYRAAHGADPELCKRIEGSARADGYNFANWTDSGWSSCYRESGMDILRAMGYRIIKGI